MYCTWNEWQYRDNDVKGMRINRKRSHVRKSVRTIKRNAKEELNTREKYMSEEIRIGFFYGVTAPSGPGPPRNRGFTITLRHNTLGGLLWTSDQPDAETSTWQHTTLNPYTRWDSNLQSLQVSGHRSLDRATTGIGSKNNGNRDKGRL